MNRTRFATILATAFLTVAAFTACEEPIEPDNPENPSEPEVPEAVTPTVTLTADSESSTETSVTFTISSTDSEQVCYVFYETGTTELPTAEYIIKEGKQVRSDKATTHTVDNLTAATSYTVVAAARAGEEYAISEAVEIQTLEKEDEPEPGPGPGEDPGPGENPGPGEDPTPDPGPQPDRTFTLNRAKSFTQSASNTIILEVSYSDDSNPEPELVVEGTLYFNLGEETSVILPAGTYSVEDGQMSDKYGTSYLRIWDYIENTNIRYAFTSGEVTVSVDTSGADDIYTIDIKVIGEDINAMNPEPYRIHASYSGIIEDMPKTE